MKRSYFLIVTAASEAITGLALLIFPELLLKLLLGDSAATPDMSVFAHWFGVVVILFSIGCWLVRNQHGSAGQYGFSLAALIYDAVAAILLTYMGLAHGLVGLLLWPAVVLHTILTGWGAMCLREKASVSPLPVVHLAKAKD